MGKLLDYIAKETQGECFASFKYCYDVGGYWGIKNSHYNFILNTRQFDGICYCKVKNSGDCRNGCETFSAN